LIKLLYSVEQLVRTLERSLRAGPTPCLFIMAAADFRPFSFTQSNSLRFMG
jgi:hypothetical protein